MTVLTLKDACTALEAKGLSYSDGEAREISSGDVTTGGDSESISARDLALWQRKHGSSPQLTALQAALAPDVSRRSIQERLNAAQATLAHGRYPLEELARARDIATTGSESDEVNAVSMRAALDLLNFAPVDAKETECDRVGPLFDVGAMSTEGALSSLGLLQQMVRARHANVQAALTHGLASARLLGREREYVGALNFGLGAPPDEIRTADEMLSRTTSRLLDAVNASAGEPLLIARVRSLTVQLLEHPSLGDGLREYFEAELESDRRDVDGQQRFSAASDSTRWDDVALDVLGLADAQSVGNANPRQRVALAWALLTVARSLGTPSYAQRDILERLGAGDRAAENVQLALLARAKSIPLPRSELSRLQAAVADFESGRYGGWRSAADRARIDVWERGDFERGTKLDPAQVQEMVGQAADELERNLRAMSPVQRARVFASPGSIGVALYALETGGMPTAFQGAAPLVSSRVGDVPPLDPAHVDEGIAALREVLTDTLTRRIEALERARADRTLRYASVRVSWPQFTKGAAKLFEQTVLPEPPTLLEAAEHEGGHGRSLDF